MLTHLRQTVEKLKSRVQKNLDIIHKNERIVKRLLEEPVSNERSRKLEEKYQENKKLLTENNDSIKLQLQLTKFIDTYKNEFEEVEDERQNKNEAPKEAKAALSREDIFELTINKEIHFDEHHPYYEDEEFFNDLMEHFSNIEDYEMCGILLDNKKKLHDS